MAFTPPRDDAHLDLQKSEHQVLTESRQAWRSSFFAVVPPWGWLGLALAFVTGFRLMTTTEQLSVLSDSALIVSTEMLLGGVLLGLAPATFFWLMAQMPPWPTLSQVRRFRVFLAAYDAYKAQEASSSGQAPVDASSPSLSTSLSVSTPSNSPPA